MSIGVIVSSGPLKIHGYSAGPLALWLVNMDQPGGRAYMLGETGLACLAARVDVIL